MLEGEASELFGDLRLTNEVLSLTLPNDSDLCMLGGFLLLNFVTAGALGLSFPALLCISLALSIMLVGSKRFDREDPKVDLDISRFNGGTTLSFTLGACDCIFMNISCTIDD